jgi:hypothetical protein
MDAAQAVTRELGEALGATGVSFLIADLSGRALVRLTHVVVAEPGPRSPDALEERRDVEESAELMPFDGGPVEQVLRTQELRLLPPGETYLGDHRAEQWTVLAPVTERGEVLGLLEMSLPIEPDAGTLAEITRIAHLLAFVVMPTVGTPTFSSGGSAAPHSPCPPRSNADSFPPPLPVKGVPSPCPRGSSRPQTSAATHLITASAATSCT